MAIARQLKHGVPSQVKFRNSAVLRTVILELVAIAAILWIGSIRGWSLATFGSHVSWKETGAGALLFAVILLTSSLFGVALNIFHLGLSNTRIAGMTLPFAILLSFINPIFEETLESGYFIHSLQPFGMWPSWRAPCSYLSCMRIWDPVALRAC